MKETQERLIDDATLKDLLNVLQVDLSEPQAEALVNQPYDAVLMNLVTFASGMDLPFDCTFTVLHPGLGPLPLHWGDPVIFTAQGGLFPLPVTRAWCVCSAHAGHEWDLVAVPAGGTITPLDTPTSIPRLLPSNPTNDEVCQVRFGIECGEGPFACSHMSVSDIPVYRHS